MEGRQTAAGYIAMFERASLLTEGNRLCGESWIFQQDNAAIHTARRIKDFFQTNNITLLSHPSCSPDLNHIENLWGWMVKEVYKHGSQCNTEEALREAVYETWKSVPRTLFEKLLTNLPKRVSSYS